MAKKPYRWFEEVIMHRIVVCLACCAGLLLGVTTAFSQGALTPPGAPAPMMKTLDQIEPRIPITNLPWTISAAGSYYLTTNLVGVAGSNGISITVSDVTLDLRGFTLQGVSGSGSGIDVPSSVQNLKIAHGVIRDWGVDGITATNADNGALADLRICNNANAGASVSRNWTVAACQCDGNVAGWGLGAMAYATIRDCTASNNKSGAGIMAGANSVLADCATFSNWVGITLGPSCSAGRCSAGNNNLWGIMTSGSCILEGCAAAFNGSNGIVVYPACRLVNCTSMNNSGDGINAGQAPEETPGCKISGCTVAWNEQNGIVVIYTGSIVENCVACRNSLDGIQVGSRCLILLNSCDSNGQSGPGWAGIRILGTNCRIDGNSVMNNNGPGIFTGPVGNACLIIRNTAHGNLADYALAGGTLNAQIINVPVLGAGFINTDPTANFIH